MYEQDVGEVEGTFISSLTSDNDNDGDSISICFLMEPEFVLLVLLLVQPFST